MSRLLLLSNSTMPGTAFFTWPQAHVKKFLGSLPGPVAFIPFAGVTLTFDAYSESVSQVFGSMGYSIQSIHAADDKKRLLQEASAIVVGGGNTFTLLAKMYAYDLLNVVRERVDAGIPYIGWSAGANLACPTLKTTNDMPIVMPPSFEALNLVPFQINPHYHELRFEGQGGETRPERLREFLVVNPELLVLGLPEGMFVQRQGTQLQVGGTGVAKLYEAGNPPMELPAGTDISHLISSQSTDLGAP